jgi:hypothetical protein
MKLEKCKNDWARVLYILIDRLESHTDMVTVLQNYSPTFYKFQARLWDLKKILPGLKITTESVPFENKNLNKKGYYYRYRCLNPKSTLVGWYNEKINIKGCSKGALK